MMGSTNVKVMTDSGDAVCSRFDPVDVWKSTQLGSHADAIQTCAYRSIDWEKLAWGY